MTGENLERFHSTSSSAGNVRSAIGVYRVTCSVTGKSYIGWSGNVHGRLSWHRSHLRKGKHSRREMQADFLKHGEASFSFEVIALCAGEHEALKLEAECIGESFKADRSYNGIVPNAADVRPRAKSIAAKPAKAAAIQALTPAQQLKLRYEEMKARRSTEAERERELAFDVMYYLGFRTKEQFLRLINAFLAFTHTSEETLSRDVTGYPKFLFALRGRSEEQFLLSDGKKFHDHILHFMQERDREYILQEQAARRAWLTADRSAA